MAWGGAWQQGALVRGVSGGIRRLGALSREEKLLRVSPIWVLDHLPGKGRHFGQTTKGRGCGAGAQATERRPPLLVLDSGGQVKELGWDAVARTGTLACEAERGGGRGERGREKKQQRAWTKPETEVPWWGAGEQTTRGG